MEQKSPCISCDLHKSGVSKDVKECTNCKARRWYALHIAGMTLDAAPEIPHYDVKYCDVCGKPLPITFEHFRWEHSVWTDICNKCTEQNNLKPSPESDIIETERVCSQCGEKLQLTQENFKKFRGGKLSSNCKKCISDNLSEAMKKSHLERGHKAMPKTIKNNKPDAPKSCFSEKPIVGHGPKIEPENEPLRPIEIECKQCGVKYKWTKDFFHPHNASGNITRVCRKCVRDKRAATEHEKRVAVNERRAVIAGVRSNSKSIVLDFSKHQEIFKKLESEAEENFRTIENQAAFIISEALKDEV